MNVKNAVVVEKTEIEKNLHSYYLDIEESISEKDDISTFFFLGKIQVLSVMLDIDINKDSRYQTMLRMINHTFKINLLKDDEEETK